MSNEFYILSHILSVLQSCWNMLLAYLPRKFAAARRKSTKLYLLLLPTVEETDKIVLLILPKKIQSSWFKWNRNYHPNSIEDILSDIVTTVTFKLSFTRHTMVPVKPQHSVWKVIYKRFQMTF